MKLEGTKSKPVGRGGATGALALSHSRKRSTFFIDQRLKTKWSNRIVVVSWCCGHQWRNSKDWKDTEQYPHHNTKANQQ